MLINICKNAECEAVRFSTYSGMSPQTSAVTHLDWPMEASSSTQQWISHSFTICSNIHIIDLKPCMLGHCKPPVCEFCVAYWPEELPRRSSQFE